MNSLQDKIWKFTKPGDFILDACCGTIESGPACLHLQQNCRFVGCERDRNLLVEAMLSVGERFPRLLLTKESDLMAPNDVLSAAKTLVEALDRNA